MEVSFRFAVRSDLGTVRTNNEDSALASPRLLVLADGMGGHAAGEVASTVATRVFAGLAEPAGDGLDVAERITLAGRSTRSALQQMSDADPVLESMGTTLLAVVSHGGEVTVGHIGDSRVYALRESSLYQVTTDHTHVQRLVDTGQLTPERARVHPYRAMLLRSLDDQPGGPDLDVISLAIEPGDRLLLCSDGLSDYLGPEQIGELLALPDRDESAQALVDAALQIGTRDNVTVVVADVVDEEVELSTTLAGAVVDGIDLSVPASAALQESLPELASTIIRRVQRDSSGDPEPDPEAAPDEAAVTAQDLAADATASQKGPVQDSNRSLEPAEAAEAAEPVDERREAPPSAPAGDREPVLPAVLAGLLVVVVAVAIWLIL